MPRGLIQAPFFVKMLLPVVQQGLRHQQVHLRIYIDKVALETLAIQVRPMRSCLAKPGLRRSGSFSRCKNQPHRPSSLRRRTQQWKGIHKKFHTPLLAALAWTRLKFTVLDRRSPVISSWRESLPSRDSREQPHGGSHHSPQAEVRFSSVCPELRRQALFHSWSSWA